MVPWYRLALLFCAVATMSQADRDSLEVQPPQEMKGNDEQRDDGGSRGDMHGMA
jgi:hypothetical protein